VTFLKFDDGSARLEGQNVAVGSIGYLKQAGAHGPVLAIKFDHGASRVAGQIGREIISHRRPHRPVHEVRSWVLGVGVAIEKIADGKTPDNHRDAVDVAFTCQLIGRVRDLFLLAGDRRSASCIVHWTDLKGEALLLSQRDPGHEIHDMVVARLASPVDRPKMVRHDISRESIKSLVGAGFGVGLTIEASLGANFAGVVHREVRDGTGPTRVGHSAYWRQDNENPALTGFLKLLRERYPSPST
jgi:hypothetical protein